MFFFLLSHTILSSSFIAPPCHTLSQEVVTQVLLDAPDVLTVTPFSGASYQKLGIVVRISFGYDDTIYYRSLCGLGMTYLSQSMHSPIRKLHS